MGQLMGIREIADRLGKTRKSVASLHHRGKLPPHDDTIGGGRTKVWNKDTIEEWIQKEEQT